MEAVIADPAGARRDAATTEGAVSEAQQQADRARRELAAARRS